MVDDQFMGESHLITVDEQPFEENIVVPKQVAITKASFFPYDYE